MSMTARSSPRRNTHWTIIASAIGSAHRSLHVNPCLERGSLTMVASCDTIFHRTPTATANLRARCRCSTGSRTSRLGAFPRSPIYSSSLRTYQARRRWPEVPRVGNRRGATLKHRWLVFRGSRPLWQRSGTRHIASKSAALVCALMELGSSPRGVLRSNETATSMTR
jgi:hypothetical protein